MVWSICHLPIVAEGYAQISKLLHGLKWGAIVMKHWGIGAKESHDFGLVWIQRQSFCDRVGVESVQLELEMLGRIGS